MYVNMVGIIFAAVSHIAMSTLAPVTAWMALYLAGWLGLPTSVPEWL